MPHLQVDPATGAIAGEFAQAQPDNPNYIDLPETDARVTAWRNPPAPVPQIISDRQFFQQLAVQGVITQDEALAAVATGTLPSAMTGLVAALPDDQKFGAKMLLVGATQFDRAHPTVPALGQAFGWDAADIDALWTAAAEL